MTDPERKCGNCRHFKPATEAEGECRASSPQVIPISVGLPWRGVWPSVTKHEYCGRHQFRSSVPAAEAS